MKGELKVIWIHDINASTQLTSSILYMEMGELLRHVG